jgi:predicted PurR-regulated permease PerM
VYEKSVTGTKISGGAKVLLLVLALIVLVILLLQVQAILAPFLWALLASYLLAPIVNYFNLRGGLPRLWSVTLLYACVGLGLVAASRYLYPQLIDDGTVFLEDIPRLEASLIGLRGAVVGTGAATTLGGNSEGKAALLAGGFSWPKVGGR